MRSPFRRRRRGRKVHFGEKGTVALRYLGEMPFETRGEYTGWLYAWSENYPMRHVDRRDLPGLKKDDFEEYPKPVEEPAPEPKKSKPKQKSAPEKPKEGEILEVVDA